MQIDPLLDNETVGTEPKVCRGSTFDWHICQSILQNMA